MGMRIVVAADIAGFDYKEVLKKDLEADERVVLEGIDRLDEGKKAEVVADDDARPAAASGPNG